MNQHIEPNPDDRRIPQGESDAHLAESQATGSGAIGPASSGSSSVGGDSKMSKMYVRFGLMIVTSMTAMFLLTYLNSYRLADARWSETRFYMSFVMGAAMAVIMLGFMLGMYRSRAANVVIFVVSAIVFSLALWLVRSQATVGDRSYMRAMIPHHSIAILTSSRADLDDVRVRELADAIIDAQKREIEEMNWLIDDIAENGKATTRDEADSRPVPEYTSSDYEAVGVVGQVGSGALAERAAVGVAGSVGGGA